MNRTLARNRRLEDALEEAVGERLSFKRVVDQGTLVNFWMALCDIEQEATKEGSKVPWKLRRTISNLKKRAYKLAYPPQL